MSAAKDRLLCLPEVKQRTSMSRSLIYKKMGEGRFPRAKQISANRVAWYETAVDAWVADPTGWSPERVAA